MSAIVAHSRHHRSAGRLRRSGAARPMVVAHRAEVGGLIEDALIERARTDPDAFGELYERHVSLVYGFIARRVPERHTAQDLTAEVFIKALRNIGRYEIRGCPFSAWLLRISTNAVADHHRVGRHACLPLETAGDVSTPHAGVDDLIVQRDEVSRVWEAVATLPTHQRLALTLRLRDDLGLAEIAAHLGKTELAVKMLIHRGQRTLRQRLPEIGPSSVPPAAR